MTEELLQYPVAVRMDYRRALEALRNGVPNRDAVRVLGCGQYEIERRFMAQWDAVQEAMLNDRQVPGLLIEGGFGTGKSHLLEYLEHLALSANFVCSRVVISKETPLFDPAKVYRAAIQTAIVPGLRGPAIPEISQELRTDTHAYATFVRWANQSDSRVSPLFPATLLLHERLRNEPELTEDILDFWSGESLPISRVRQGLRQVGAARAYAIKVVPIRELALQRIRFVARLICGAGYRGWIWLIDEAELIGRYSILQRGRAYGELARWLGRIEGDQYPGLTAVAAITDDFSHAVLQQKGDREHLVPRLQSRGTDEYTMLAARAETGMQTIEHDSLPLQAPDEEMLQHTYLRLKQIHAHAYGWVPPDVSIAELSSRRAMRAHVRRWINEWDLARLYPGVEVRTIEEDVGPQYNEDMDADTLDLSESTEDMAREYGGALP